MRASRGSDIYEIRTGMNSHNLNDMQPIQLRLSSPDSRSYNQEYRNRGTRDDDRYEIPTSESSSYNRVYRNQETRNGDRYIIPTQEPRSSNKEYRHQKTRNDDKRQTSTRKCCGCCSKQCAVGLGIGLTISVLIAIAAAIPVGVIRWEVPLRTISSTPNWVGTYQMDTSCDTGTCCCFTNQLVMSQTSSTQIRVTGSVTGACVNLPSTVSQTVSLPIGFQLLFSWNGEIISFQLGQDNYYITLVNVNYPYCSVTALRTSYNAGSMKSMNLGLTMLILLITMGLMVR